MDLLKGNIIKTLIKLALPIMGTSMIQMAYNLTDMMWIGRVGSEAVTAIGTAGIFLWIGNAISMLPRMGGQVRTGYHLGERNIEQAKLVVDNTLKLTAFLSLVFTIVLLFFNKQLIDFYRLKNMNTVMLTRSYLLITSFGVIPSCFNIVMTGLITATGNSRTPFIANTIGLIINIILDPLLIFGFGIFEGLGVNGAAFATVCAQLVVFSVMVAYAVIDKELFHSINFFAKPNIAKLKDIIKVGLPTSLQEIFFACIAMIISRIVIGFGDFAVAIQSVGSQVESLSWMTAQGFASALNAFISQNYGAGNIDRAKRGYSSALRIIIVWGSFTTLLLLCFSTQIFGIFIDNKDIVVKGAVYLRIMAVSQLFMCLEIVSSGAFCGFGQTMIPSSVGIIFNLLRIPGSFLLAYTFNLGLEGVWWSITLSSVLKGTILFLLYKSYSFKHLCKDMVSN